MFSELKLNIKYDALICLNGELPEIDFFKKFKPKNPILAADGAYSKLLNLGITADYAIGDLDSLKENGGLDKIPQEKLIYDPSQEYNDFEKTLKFAISNNYSNLLILGFHGGELEHTLNNWSVLSRFGKVLNLCIFDKNRFCIPIYKSFTCNELKPSEIVSLIPQPKALLKTKGFKWELNYDWLKLGEKEGARNIALSNEISIEIIEGEILFTCDARLSV